MNRRKTSGDNRRSTVEAAIGRSKRVIGAALGSREDARREGEVKIAVKALDRRLETRASNPRARRLIFIARDNPHSRASKATRRPKAERAQACVQFLTNRVMRGDASRRLRADLPIL
jgi:hypothetical protein